MIQDSTVNFFPGQRPASIPLSLVGAMLVAMSAIGYTAAQPALLSALGILLIASRTTTRRLPDNRSIQRGVRIALFIGVIVLVGWPESNVRYWYTKPEYTNLIGCAMAAELVIRAWETKRYRPQTNLIFSVLIFGCAGNTYDARLIPWLAPIFVGLILLSLRGITPQDHAQAGGMSILRTAIILLTLALGVFTVGAFARFQRRIELLTMDFFRQRAAAASDIGLSDGPVLQSVFNPEPSMDRILLVDGPRQERYLRVLAFDTLVNNKWGPPLRLQNAKPIDQATLQPAYSTQVDEALRFHLLGDTFGVLPLPLNAASVTANSGLLRDDHGALHFAADTENASYEVTLSKIADFQGPLTLVLDETRQAIRAQCLALPKGLDARITQLAKQVAGEGDPRMHVLRLAQHLRANHAYSLEYNPGPGDALADFILNNRAAHCQYFASALVIMARAVEVPARLVTGYYLHEAQGDRRMVARDRDAHAWAECWIEGVGWITVDATPAGGKPDAIFGAPSRWRLAWEQFTDIPSTIREWIGGLTQNAVLATALVATVFVLLSGVLQLRRRKDANAGPAYARPANQRLIRMATRFEKWLKRRERLQPHATWREAVNAIGDPLECVEFLNFYDQARFGDANGASIEMAWRCLEKVERLGFNKLPQNSFTAGRTGAISK